MSTLLPALFSTFQRQGTRTGPSKPSPTWRCAIQASTWARIELHDDPLNHATHSHRRARWMVVLAVRGCGRPRRHRAVAAHDRPLGTTLEGWLEPARQLAACASAMQQPARQPSARTRLAEYL